MRTWLSFTRKSWRKEITIAPRWPWPGNWSRTCSRSTAGRPASPAKETQPSRQPKRLPVGKTDAAVTELGLPGLAVVGLGDGIEWFLRPTSNCFEAGSVPKLNLLFGGDT